MLPNIFDCCKLRFENEEVQILALFFKHLKFKDVFFKNVL